MAVVERELVFSKFGSNYLLDSLG